MWRNNKINGGGFVLLVFLFVVLPFINVHSAIDPDLNPRLIAISAFCMICFFVFSRKPIELPDSFRNIGLSSLAIVAITLLSILPSINKGDALAEWLRIFIVYAFFALSVVILRKSNLSLITVIRFVSTAILIFSAFAMVQTFPVIEAIVAHKDFQITSDLASTLSNKNFFSEVLVLLIPGAFFGLLNDEKKFKLLHLSGFLLAALYILILASLACLIAIAVAVVIVGVVLMTRNSSIVFSLEKRSNFILPIVAVLLLSIGVFVFKKVPVVKNMKFKVEMISKYISDPTLIDQNINANNNSIFDRILMIRNSLKMIADHPLLGSGLNNWKLLYSSYGIGGTEVINSGAMNFEHPHNDYLLIFSEQGIFGLIFYLAFFFFVFKSWMSKSKEKSDEEKLFLLVILFVVIAFFVMSFFSYPRSRIYTPILLMFFISMLFRNDNSQEKKFVIKPLFAILLGVISLIAVIVTSIRLDSEVHAKKLITAKYQKNFARMIRESEKINPYFYPIDITNTSIDWYRGMALFYSGQIPAALKEYQKAILKTPFHLRTMNDLATTYEQTGTPDSSIAYYKKALSISPYLTDSRLNLSATYFNQNKIDSAYQTLNFLTYPEIRLGPQEEYVKFMSVILSARIIDSLKSSKDTVLINKMNTFVNDIPQTKNYIRGYVGKTLWPDVFTDVK